MPILSPYFLLALVFGAGFCILGVQFGNIATEANIYPTYIRAWGVGSNFAIGRIGGALGPLLGGFAFGAKLPAQQIFLIATLRNRSAKGPLGCLGDLLRRLPIPG
jgi:AAHS family 4-hydroxybenzoate transporter-like MFS transporter